MRNAPQGNHIESWNEIDSAHCTALKHEFLRCEDAFKDFESSATIMIMQIQNGTASPHEKRYIAYKTYNAYSRFIHHLYEFMVGAAARENRRVSKNNERATDADRFITAEMQRVLTGRRKAIQNGTAPTWENHISYYPEHVPQDFARDFRQCRNKISGHVTHERSTLSLSEFYAKYHKYLHMLYWNCLSHWGLHRQNEFPDMREITDFSVIVKKNTDMQAS